MSDTPPEGGAVLVARVIQDSEVWSMPPRYLKVWIYLLLNARWAEDPHNIGPVTVGRGQTLKSYRRIAVDCEYTENQQVKAWSTSQVKRVLDWLESRNMIKTAGTDLGTLITVCNFKRYQDFQTYTLDLGTDLGTPAEHLRNNRKKEETRNTLTTRGREELPWAIERFMAATDSEWKLKTSPADWLDAIEHDYPGVRVEYEIRKAAEWYERKGKKIKAPDRAIRNWLEKAEPSTNGSGQQATWGPTTPEELIEWDRSL